MICRAAIPMLLLIFMSIQALAQESYAPAKENLEAREWFQDAKFGLFIHWGVYSNLAGGGDQGVAEWIMEHKKIPVAQYEKLPLFFNPVAFDAKEWVSMAKNAGMKYITITSKHHDGFAMYDSKVSDYDIVDRTPYEKDIIRMLSEECKREGIKLFFYYSQLDWHHPDYFPRGRTGNDYTGRPEKGDWDAYLQYMNAQLTELLTNYGEVGGIWFDGMWDKKDADWKLEETYSLIHQLQPAALVGSNHHLKPFPGEDFQMFEQDLPGENTTGFGGTYISQLPLEMALTINNSWGYNLIDQGHKSPEKLIELMVKAAGRNANLLLNVGPMPSGEIQEEHKASLAEMGKWMDEYGETIYGTRGGPVAPQTWGVSTAKGKKVYLHVLDPKERVLFINGFKPKIKSIALFRDKSPVKYEMNKYGLILEIPKNKIDSVDTIIEISLK